MAMAMTPHSQLALTIVAAVVMTVVADPSPPPPLTSTAAPPNPSHSTAKPTSSSPAPAPKPDTVDDVERRLDVILNNTRSRENYIRCFMDRGICNKEANAIKKILGDALTANCSKCGERERAGARRFVEYLKRAQPETWLKMEAKYGRGKDKMADKGKMAAKGAKGGGATANRTGTGDKSGSDTDDDDDEDDDDEDERKKKGGEKKAKGVAGGSNSTVPANAAKGAGHGSVSMIF